MAMAGSQEVANAARSRAGAASITVSIVSHGHARWVQRLVPQVLACPQVAHLILTRNIAEEIGLPSDSRLSFVDNMAAKGFGANHNAAFRACRTPYFCVLNPDVWWTDDPFPDLLSCLEASRAAVAGPLVVGPDGHSADSIRRFPTILSLLRKAVGGDDGRYQTTFGASCFPADWVAGMCMLFQSADFAAVGGFDEAFFLYYEDVDICARLWYSGRPVTACTKSLVTHSAQRASRHRAVYMRRHLASMALYLWKYRGRRPRCSSSPPRPAA
jgi:N-acetylglucosaminyl-diphospho-decaprenol L-rhamnosyltransferase